MIKIKRKTSVKGKAESVNRKVKSSMRYSQRSDRVSPKTSVMEQGSTLVSKDLSQNDKKQVRKDISGLKIINIWNKIKTPRVFIPLIVIIVLVLAVIFGQRLIFVAYVNGKPITRMAYYSALEQKDGVMIMQNLVVESLINQETNKKGIVVTNKDVLNAEKTIEAQLSSQGQNLDNLLSQQGLTREQFEEQLKIQQQVEKLLGNKVKVTDKQIDDYISQNQSSFPPSATGSALRSEVKQQLFQQQLTVLFQSFITNLEKKAHITYLTNIK